MSSVPNTKEIKAYLHCNLCWREKPKNVFIRDYQQLEVGWTDLGIQVWCRRHNVNIVHIDFEKNKHPANTTIDRTPPSSATNSGTFSKGALAAQGRPENYSQATPEMQWEVDKKLGILDWDGT